MIGIDRARTSLGAAFHNTPGFAFRSRMTGGQQASSLPSASPHLVDHLLTGLRCFLNGSSWSRQRRFARTGQTAGAGIVKFR